MPLTAEQQAHLDFSQAQDLTRDKHQLLIQSRGTKLELARVAKDILIENSRSKPVEEREISAADVTAFTEVLVEYVNS